MHPSCAEHTKDSIELISATAKDLFARKRYRKLSQYLPPKIKDIASDNPQLPLIHDLLGRTLVRLGQPDDALVHLQKAITLDPKFVEGYLSLGDLYRQTGQLQVALSTYVQANKIDSKHENCLLKMALIHKQLGDLSNAIACYRNILRIDPKSAVAYRNLGSCHYYRSVKHGDVKAIMNILADPKVTRKKEMQAHFALGKIYDDCDRYDQAFMHFQYANTLCDRSGQFDFASYRTLIDTLIRRFTQGYANDIKLAGSQSNKPIIVLGLSRSGKSMIQRIMAKHEAIYAKDEVSAIKPAIRSARSRLQIRNFYESVLPSLDNEAFRGMAKIYLAKLERNMDNSIARIVDTTPSNFRHFGLLYQLFPNASFIHCTRHPLDQCLQIYFRYYVRGNSYAFKLHDIAHFYMEYRRLMAHWHKVFPGKILEVSYEALLNDPKATARRIFGHINMACNEEVMTVCDQFDQPLHNRELNRWRHYEKYLGLVKTIIDL